MRTKSLAIFACFALTALPYPAMALQTVSAKDGVAIEAIVSSHEPTRIRVDGAKIVDVIGNIYSSTCAPKQEGGVAAAPVQTNPSGEFVLGCDLPKGEIYIRPVGKDTKPINIFVTTEFATYTLVLRRSNVPADTIVISDTTVRAPRISGARTAPGKSAPHVRTVKAMLVAMAGNNPGTEYTVRDVREPTALWAEASFEKIRVVTGGRLVGDQYLLTNISQETMVLAEQEFDRDGDGVVGVCVEQLNLKPGESTTVYVIRMGEQ